MVEYDCRIIALKKELADAEALIDTQSKALVQGAKREEVLKEKAERLEAFVQAYFAWQGDGTGVDIYDKTVKAKYAKLRELAETVRYVTELAPKVME